MNKHYLIFLAWHVSLIHAEIPFIGTVKLGSEKLARRHLKCDRSSLNLADELGNTPLHYAVNIDSHAIVQLLIDYHANLNIPNNAGTTALHIAVRHRNPRMVRTLVHHGANPTQQDNGGNTPLHLVASYAHTQCGVEVIKALQAYGADPSCHNKAHETALTCVHTHYQTAHDLSLFQAHNLTQAESSLSHAPTQTDTMHLHKQYLHCAKTNNVIKMRRLLKNPHLNINCQTPHYQRSALMQALRYRRISMAKLLIESGVCIDLCDNNGDTTYTYVQRYCPAMIPLLAHQKA